MSHSWDKIEKHYVEAAVYMSAYAEMHNAMAGLCSWIRKNELSKSLFGQTSMHSLRIYQSDFEGQSHHSAQFLRLNPDFDTKMIEFNFVDTHLAERQWSRSELPESELLINRFIGFMNQVGWSRESLAL